MTREKYESLPLATLKELAKARKMRGVSTLKKGDLIDAMLELDEQEEQKEAAEEAREEVKEEKKEETDIEQLDSGFTANGILEVLQDGYGFIRSDNYLPGDGDVYVAPSQIRRFGLKTGDILTGNTRVKTQGEKFSALLYVSTINGLRPAEAMKRKNFEDLTPIFPNQRIRLENPGCTTAMRIVDLVSPIGKGQRGMIVSPPKAGKTTLLKEVALSVQKTEPNMHLLILLIDERPEEVTDIREAIEGPNVEVIHSTFDELPEHHKRVSEMVISRAKRLVEHGKDVMILLDSITRLSRAYNLIVPPSGRTLSGGLDPAALYSPKRFFGAARNMREGGSLTILATALVDTGSKMDDVVYEEFKGTGNMELMLDRKLQEKRVFPAIDIPKSGTRREDLLLTKEEQDAVYIMRKAMNGMKSEEAVDNLLNMFSRTKTNEELSSFDETISVVQSGINGSANILFSTENRRCFRELEHIKCSCNPGDIIIISNFESLGMNDTDIKENLDFFIQNSIKLVIKDIPSTYEYGVGTSTNIAVIRTIFDLIKSTNQKITPIRTSRRAGAGRTKLDFPESWEELYTKWEQKEITSSEFIKQSGLKKASFYNLMAEYRKILETNKKYKEKYGC